MDYLHESAASIYHRRRRQRLIITMTCVSLLLFGTVVYAASYVQGWVGAATPTAVATPSCDKATLSRALTPRDVTVNVYNTTDHTGLAASAARSLQKQGFRIATIDNDPLAKTIPGVGEIRHGQGGAAGAVLAAARLPGARLVLDDRMDASVDLVLGAKFRTLIVPTRSARLKAAKLTTHC